MPNASQTHIGTCVVPVGAAGVSDAGLGKHIPKLGGIGDGTKIPPALIHSCCGRLGFTVGGGVASVPPDDVPEPPVVAGVVAGTCGTCGVATPMPAGGNIVGVDGVVVSTPPVGVDGPGGIGPLTVGGAVPVAIVGGGGAGEPLVACTSASQSLTVMLGLALTAASNDCACCNVNGPGCGNDSP